MHEKSTAYRTRESILDHKRVRDMDPHERHALAKQTAKMSRQELNRKLRELYNR